MKHRRCQSDTVSFPIPQAVNEQLHGLYVERCKGFYAFQKVGDLGRTFFAI